jgi:hypothetical protein
MRTYAKTGWGGWGFDIPFYYFAVWPGDIMPTETRHRYTRHDFEEISWGNELEDVIWRKDVMWRKR